MSAPNDYVPVATTTRSDVVENVHHGAAVALDPDGQVIWSIGNPDAEIYGRSANKPLQAAAMLALGLELDPEQLAIAVSSHSGAPQHLAMVRSVLSRYGLDESALQNTPDLPYDPDVAFDYVAAGNPKSSIAQNCSGKHAAMLATCVVNDWDVDSYLEPDHQLQVAINESLSVAANGLAHVGVDGCGAPTHMTTLAGLAGAFGAIAKEQGAIWAAMTTHPHLVAGDGRPTTQLMQAQSGIIAKDGADAVFAGALPDGTSFATKVAGGMMSVAGVVLARAAQAAGHFADIDPSTFANPVTSRGEVIGHIEPIV